MEWPLELDLGGNSLTSLDCFNPYYSGMAIRTVARIDVLDERKGFNPYYSGMAIRTPRICSFRARPSLVSILIIVEWPLELWSTLGRMLDSSRFQSLL